MDKENIKQIIKEDYSKIASEGCCGCSCGSKKISREIGYSEDEMNNVPEANLGLGCGNPLALAEIKEGDVVLDLGSGAGFDAFLAAKKVGGSGKVIGLDFSEEMVSKAKINAQKYGYNNVEFILGDIENIPLEDSSIDVIISNCVINLAPNKKKVFEESFRVLKGDGRMFVSDIVLLEELTSEQRKDRKLISGCVAGALQKEEYVNLIKEAGFEVNIIDEDRNISKTQYDGINLESLKVECIKR